MGSRKCAVLGDKRSQTERRSPGRGSGDSPRVMRCARGQQIFEPSVSGGRLGTDSKVQTINFTLEQPRGAG